LAGFSTGRLEKSIKYFMQLRVMRLYLSSDRSAKY